MRGTHGKLVKLNHLDNDNEDNKKAMLSILKSYDPDLENEFKNSSF